jgi:8-oxo-dGTP pyrophosphatase MutT (NUDIX family)
MSKYWQKLNFNREYQNRVLSVDHIEYFFEKEKASMVFTVVNTIDWVVVIPILENGKFALVRQFRVGIEDTTYEFPGGGVNLYESKEDAATRELREETGLIYNNLTFLGEVHPNPALMSNSAYIYLATGCKKRYSLKLDKFEDIEVKYFTRQEFEEKITSGEIKHSIVLSAYTLYLAKSAV